MTNLTSKLKRIKLNPIIFAVPVIVLSSFSLDRERERERNDIARFQHITAYNFSGHHLQIFRNLQNHLSTFQFGNIWFAIITNCMYNNHLTVFLLWGLLQFSTFPESTHLASWDVGICHSCAVSRWFVMGVVLSAVRDNAYIGNPYHCHQLGFLWE